MGGHISLVTKILRLYEENGQINEKLRLNKYLGWFGTRYSTADFWPR